MKYSIDYSKLNSNKKKSNIISYMPRKLFKHSELVISFLRNSLPKKWKIKQINNNSENEVFNILKKSKIFLAFSNLEGLPLPPIEAALAGNKVIGYTGEGGKEYWKEPLFTEIKNSEIKNFCKCILKNIQLVNFLETTKKKREILAKRFSIKQEKKYLHNLLEKIKNIK